MLKQIKKELQKAQDKEKAQLLQRFFKTGKGEYGEGDIFLGVVVPKQREIVKKFDLDEIEIQKLLESEIHEERLTGALFLVKNFEKAKKEKNENKMKKIFDFYLKNTEHFNNWDLVDLSAPRVIGGYLLSSKNERKILYELSKSNKKGRNGWQWLWEKRIAILATFAFIKENDFDDTLKLCKFYLNEKHDLMHKASGWMLREIGKRDEKILKDFLNKHCKIMPKTMLRYAIEKLSEKERKKYLKK